MQSQIDTLTVTVHKLQHNRCAPSAATASHSCGHEARPVGVPMPTPHAHAHAESAASVVNELAIVDDAKPKVDDKDDGKVFIASSLHKNLWLYKLVVDTSKYAYDEKVVKWPM